MCELERWTGPSTRKCCSVSNDVSRVACTMHCCHPSCGSRGSRARFSRARHVSKSIVTQSTASCAAPHHLYYISAIPSPRHATKRVLVAASPGGNWRHADNLLNKHRRCVRLINEIIPRLKPAPSARQCHPNCYRFFEHAMRRVQCSTNLLHPRFNL